MKTSLTIFPCVLGSAFPIIRVCLGLSFVTKRIGPPCCTLFTFVTCCSLTFILSQNYLLPFISVLVENTLLKTAYHFLLLLVGFDTLTYRKDCDRSPILVGHHSYIFLRSTFPLHFYSDLLNQKYFAEKLLSFPSAPHWVRHSYLSKEATTIPYTCGLSRPFSGAVARES